MPIDPTSSQSADIAVSVRELGKRFAIGGPRGYGRFSEALAHIATAPARLLRNGLTRDSSSAQESSSNEFWALSDVNFDIRKGEVVGIIGRNGAGKSTLLKVLSRITEPSCGEAVISGRIGSLLEVGTGFHPELTGRENIFLNGAILGMGRKEILKHFDRIVDFAGVEAFLETPVKRYSSGMYMRLAFAVAAHLEPEILVIDEVLAVGDAEFQAKCLGQMKSVAASGRTVLFVSHNTNAVEQLCSQIIWLEKGQVRANSHDVPQTLAEYMCGDSAESSVTEWYPNGDVPSNDWFRPISFRIIDEHGQSAAAVNRRDARLILETSVEILKPSPSLTFGYAIYSDTGHLLYWSTTADCQEHVWPDLNTGPRRLQTQLPLHFLNEGSYRVEFICGLHFKEWFYEPGNNSPSIAFTVAGGLSQSPMWTTRRPGALAPILQWHNAAFGNAPSIPSHRKAG